MAFLSSSAVALAVVTVLMAVPARSAETDPTPANLTRQECGACHMPYPPQFLPAASWLTILLDLNHHFGENATVDRETVLTIADFLASHAADAPQVNSQFLRGLDPEHLPLRVTETPYWIRRHHELSEANFARESVKSKSNCPACHN